MITAALLEAVDALSVEDRRFLIEYLERTIDDLGDEPLTDEQLATLDRRNAELDADPTLGLSKDEFLARLRAKWL